MAEMACNIKEPVTWNSDNCKKMDSDETFDNPCQPCLSEDKHVESRKFCEDCREFLCDGCIEFHTKLTLTKKHKLINKDVADTEIDVPKKKEMKILPVCSLHDGKSIDQFCNKHELSMCRACAVIYHASCVDIISIEEAAMNARAIDEAECPKEILKYTRNEYKEYIERRNGDKTRVNGEFNEALENLEKSKAKLINIIDKLKSFDEQKIKQKFETVSNAISKDIKNCEEVDDVLASAQESIETTGEYDIHTFTQRRIIDENIQSAQRVLSAKEPNSELEKIVYKTSNEIANMLKTFKNLGELEREDRVYFYSQSAHNQTKINLQDGRNKRQIDAESICILDDDFLLITDWENESLILVQISTNNNRRYLNFEHAPFDVCKMPNKKVAVTLFHGHSVKIISYDFPSSLKEESGFDTVKKCKGITHFEDLLYVLCGDEDTENEGPGQIRAYTVTGELQTIIVFDHYAQDKIISRPWKILVSFFNEMYVVDISKGLLKIKDNIVCQTNYKTGIGSIAFDQNDYVFATAVDKSVVQQLKADGTLVGTVLTVKDGLNKPMAIAFDCKNNILYVTTKDSSELLITSDNKATLNSIC